MSHSGPALRRTLIRIGLFALVLSALLAVAFDSGIGLWLENRVPLRVALVEWQRVIDVVFLKPINSIVGPVLLLWSYWGWRQGWLTNRFMIGWGSVLTGASYSVFLIKGLMGRERPIHWLVQDDRVSNWFLSDNQSFPSGHTTYYWALILPLAVRYPRFGIPALAIAFYVTIQRVLVLAHHWSDVLAAIGIVFLWTAAFAPLLIERAPDANRRLR